MGCNTPESPNKLEFVTFARDCQQNICLERLLSLKILEFSKLNEVSSNYVSDKTREEVRIPFLSASMLLVQVWVEVEIASRKTVIKFTILGLQLISY